MEKAGNNEAVTFTHQQQLLVKQREAERDHYQIAGKIMEDHYGKTGETVNQWNERLTKYALKQIEEENKLAETEGRNTEKFKKDQQDKIDAIEAFQKKWEENAAQMKAIDDEVATMKEKSASEHKYAGGSGAFLEGLGINTGEQAEKDKQFEIDRQAAKTRQSDAFNAAENAKDELEKQKHLIDAKKAGEDITAIDIAQLKSHDELVLEAKRKISEETITLAQQTAETISTIRNNQFAAEQQALQYEQATLERTSQQKIAAINATAGYQITKDNEVAKVVAQTTAQQNAIQQKQNELALKKAKADKEAAEAGIILNTALGISKVLAVEGLDPILAAAEIALITAIGAAQYAAAASTPLPQFFTGGTTETPIFRAGEQGRELGITPSGEAMMFNSDAIYSAPIGTEIKNNADTERIINYAVNNTGKLVAYEAPTMTDKNIIDELKENRKTMIEIAMMKTTPKTTVIVNNGYNPLQRPKK